MAKSPKRKLKVVKVDNRPEQKKDETVQGGSRVDIGRELIRNGGDITKTASYGKDVLPFRTSGQTPAMDNFQEQQEKIDGLVIRLWNRSNKCESDLRAVIKHVWKDKTCDVFGNLVEQKYAKYDAYCRNLLSLPPAKEDKWLG